MSWARATDVSVEDEVLLIAAAWKAREGEERTPSVSRTRFWLGGGDDLEERDFT